MGAIHESGKPLINLAGPLAGLEYCGIDPRIDIEKEPPNSGPPVLARIGEHICHDRALRQTAASNSAASNGAASNSIVLLAKRHFAGHGLVEPGAFEITQYMEITGKFGIGS
jgi:hypothetical protein